MSDGRSTAGGTGGVRREDPLTALVDRIRAGEAIALHQFYLRVEPFLRAVARRWLTPSLRKQVDSGDVAHSAVRRMVAGSMRVRFENEARVLAWLATVARNRIRTLSRRTRGPAGEGMVALDAAGDAATDARGPADWAETAEEVRNLRAAMETLPEDERRAIVLRDFEWRSFDDVAATLDRPSADAARKLHGRALARLRRALGGDSEGASG